MVENLNERKRRILEAVIMDYISTAEPVGSRTLAKKLDLGLSSATIRNEMSDLEDMGLLRQPHASSGRIPSNKGYRFYVDKIMEKELGTVLSGEDCSLLRDIVRANVNKADFLMKETAKVISRLTNLAAVVTAPSEGWRPSRFMRLHLTEMDSESIVLLVITEEKTVRHFVIEIPKETPAPNADDLLKLSNALNAALKGSFNKYAFIGDNQSEAPKLEEIFDTFAPLLPELLKKAFSALDNENRLSIYASGIKNLISFPEFSGTSTAQTLIKTLEETESLYELLDECLPPFSNQSENIQILIGDENKNLDMRNCSVIKTHYAFGNGYGSISILGPTRMNYAQVTAILDTITKNIRLALH